MHVLILSPTWDFGKIFTRVACVCKILAFKITLLSFYKLEK
ncbi:hypothetical protein HMPREF0580_0234 [Mobiluncus mulieris ATCC 35239]|uniref:Uncharacterized protein n=1 Tax=Mobiluncus mulieris ATCC 35239 TaxID=871571 RepID=E0QMX0_9ACTO|nr:hypothetical protein HMPREF0577_1870 [Mobiluncus mulieris ATCC 35243]EFM47137.1 hypothetical protein HMPREF0580_0234 [Mobiluncus mulieris ATCC 35239]